MQKSRTQDQRSAATRESLIAAGLTLFGTRGYAAVGTEEIVQTAGVSRGALYHQFADKSQLFAAVFESVSAEVIGRITAAIAKSKRSDPIALLRLGASCWLDACGEPDVHQIALVDAPAVLGVTQWRAISARYGTGLVEGMLARAVDVGRIKSQPIAPLAHVLLGALREGAIYLADSEDQVRARKEVGTVIDRLVQSLASDFSAP